MGTTVTGAGVRNPWGVRSGLDPDPFAAHIPNHCEITFEGVRCDQSGRHLCAHCLTLCCPAHCVIIASLDGRFCQYCAWNYLVYGTFDEPETDVA